MSPRILLRTQSDERLAALAAAGHERAFESIVERYRGPLTRSVRRVVPPANVEDAVQATFLCAWDALRRGTPVADLRPWLYAIARNAALKTLERAGRASAELLEEDHQAGPAVPEVVELRASLRATLGAVAALPPAQRAALSALTFEGRSRSDIAAELGLSEGAVRQLVHRARVAVRAAATAVVPWSLAAQLAGGGGVGAGVSSAGGVGALMSASGSGAAATGGTGALALGLSHGIAAVVVAGAAIGLPALAIVRSAAHASAAPVAARATVFPGPAGASLTGAPDALSAVRLQAPEPSPGADARSEPDRLSHPVNRRGRRGHHVTRADSGADESQETSEGAVDDASLPEDAAPTDPPPDDPTTSEPTPTETPASEPAPSATPAPEPAPSATPAPDASPGAAPTPDPSPARAAPVATP